MRNKAFLLLLLFCKTRLFMWEKMHYENHSRTLLIPRGLKPKVTESQFIAKTCKNIGKHVQMKAFRQKVLNDDDGSLGRDKDVLSLLLPSYCANKHPKLNCCQGQNNQIFSSYIFSATYIYGHIAKKTTASIFFMLYCNSFRVTGKRIGILNCDIWHPRDFEKEARKEGRRGGCKAKTWFYAWFEINVEQMWVGKNGIVLLVFVSH